MKCPKCDEGTLVKIQFKTSKKLADLCDYCDALWFDNEKISETTGHSLRVYSQGEEAEFEEHNEQDQDHQPVQNVRNL